MLAAGRALLPAIPTSPAAALDAAVRLTSEHMRGKRITVRAGGGDVPMTVRGLSCASSTVRLAQGRIDEMRCEAEDVDWPGTPLARLDVVCRDLRFAGPLSTSVTAVEVRVDVLLSPEVVQDRIDAARPGPLVRFGEATQVSWPPFPGSLEVEPTVVDGRVLLTPLAVRLGGRRLGLRARPVELAVPELPRGLRLTSVTATADGLRLRCAAEQWRDRLAATPVSELISMLVTAATTLTVGR